MGAINFDDVYAKAYVRKSVEVLAATTTRQYPMLANYEDEIRQDLWIAINRKLSLFDPARGAVDTFCRRVMNSALKDIRRKYFSKKSIFNRNTVEMCSEASAGENWTEDVNRAILIADVRALVMSLPPIQGSICRMIMDGWPMRRIAAHHKISIALLYRKYINPLKKNFAELGL